MRELFKINLRLFDQTAPMKSTDGAAGGATDNNLQAEIKTYYVKELLKNAAPQLVYNQFGQKKPIPKGAGKTIEWRKFSKLPPATIPIVEGVVPKGSKRSVITKTASPMQYGDYIRHTDIIETTAFDPIITEDCKEQGVQAGKTIDVLTRDKLMAGTNVMYANGKISRATLTDKAADVITVNDVYKAVNRLQRMDVAPVEGGSYVAIVHPDIYTQLMLDDKWIDVNKYSNASNIFNGEVGKIGNCRFVSTSQAPIVPSKLTGANPASDALGVYQTLFLGANAYGTTEIEGLGLEYIIKPKGYNDELDLVGSTGWKMTHGCRILDQTAILRYESLSFRSDETDIYTYNSLEDINKG